MRTIGKQQIEDMSVGAAVLGAGGGGDPYVGKLMALQAVEEFGEVTLLDVDEVPDDVMVASANMIGAPTVLVEKIPSGTELQNAFDHVSKALGQKVFGVIPFEAGGINSMLPLVLAASNNLPLIDADGMGRAFPEIQMVTWSLQDIPCTPACVCDEKGNCVSVTAKDNVWAERLCRNATAVMGGSCYMSCYPMTGKQMKASSIRGTTTKSETIGRVIRKAKSKKLDPLAALKEVTGGIELFRGKIIDVNRNTVGGFVRGETELDGLEGYKGSRLKISFQNENLVAIRDDGTILCTVPDLIIMLDLEATLPVTTETLKYGARVVVLGIPCSPLWRSERGISVVGPGYFGYPDIPYIPVEERNK